MRITIILILCTALIFCQSCKKDKKEDAQAYTLTSSWGTLGSDDNELQYPDKILIAEDCIFLKDAINQKIKKFTSSGQLIAKLDFESAFYIFENYLYCIHPDNDSILCRYTLNLEPDTFYRFNEKITNRNGSYNDISGCNTHALVTLGGSSEPFLNKLDIVNGTVEPFGELGSGNLEFRPNGLFPVRYRNNKYYIGDSGGKRIQVLDAGFNYTGQFATEHKESVVGNSPTVLSVGDSYIAVSHDGSSSDQVNLYNVSDHSLAFTFEAGDFFKLSIAFDGSVIYLATDEPKIRIYKRT